jgi:hypothetical protein
MIAQQTATGGVLQATWFADSLLNRIPGALVALGGIATGLNPLLEALGDALTAVTVAQEIAVLLPELPNAADLLLTAAINLVIDTIVSLVESLRSSGQSFIILPPTPGGMRGASGVIRAALMNARDPQRPNFGPFSFVAGWGMIAAADLGTIQRIVDAFNALFLAVDGLAAQANFVKTVPTLTFPDPFAINKLVGRAAPQNVPPWVAARIVDLIPGSEDALDTLVAALKSLRAKPINLPLSDHFAFLQKIIARIKAILAIVIAIVTLLQSLFLDIPVKIIEFEEQIGSTQDISDSVAAWFAPGQSILSDVGDQLYTCGIFSVIGSIEPASVGAQLSLLQSLILPTPSASTSP